LTQDYPGVNPIQESKTGEWVKFDDYSRLKELTRKYLNDVVANEGTAFLPCVNYDHLINHNFLTDEEQAEFVRLLSEVS
jgi:hypothetical protein